MATFELSVAVFEAALASVFEFESAGVSAAVLFRTDVPPLKAGIEISRAEIMNITAATIVIFPRTVAVPRGPKALLETLLVNSAPASVLPGWRRTDPTSAMHDKKNNVYRTYNKGLTCSVGEILPALLVINYL